MDNPSPMHDSLLPKDMLNLVLSALLQDLESAVHLVGHLHPLGPGWFTPVTVIAHTYLKLGRCLCKDRLLLDAAFIKRRQDLLELIVRFEAGRRFALTWANSPQTFAFFRDIWQGDFHRIAEKYTFKDNVEGNLCQNDCSKRLVKALQAALPHAEIYVESHPYEDISNVLVDGEVPKWLLNDGQTIQTICAKRTSSLTPLIGIYHSSGFQFSYDRLPNERITQELFRVLIY